MNIINVVSVLYSDGSLDSDTINETVRALPVGTVFTESEIEDAIVSAHSQESRSLIHGWVWRALRRTLSNSGVAYPTKFYLCDDLGNGKYVRR
jgi:hypothetical protein